MPQYLHPGVYIEEIERGPRPIEGVPTSMAAFLGETERGPITPRLVTSYREYQRWFGDIFDRDKFVPYTINGFFENGGKQAYVARLVSSAATSGEAAAGDFTIRASGPGKWGKRVFVKVTDSSTTDADKKPIGFRLRLAYWSDATPYDVFLPDAKGTAPDLTEDFDDLVTKETSPDFYGKRFPFIDPDKSPLNQGPESSALAILVRKSGAAADVRPTNGTYTLDGGDDPTALTDADYTGFPAGTRKDLQGLEALKLDPYREISLVYSPAIPTSTAKLIVGHCEEQRFRFAVFDSQKGAQIGELNPRNAITDSNYAAFYYPWIFVSDPRTGARKMIPPGGHVLGVYARTDSDRGVFKAPANEILRGTLDLEADINDNNQDTVNPLGVNVTRSFPGRGIRVWGARTITSNSLWKYVNVRRLFIFLERSIYEGTQWVVFEPNDDRLWARVIDTIRLFLRTQWRLGALMGRTEQEAFHITCDRTTMTQDDILNGRLICEIGIAPVRPAEFVVFRIFQDTAEAQR
jgi:phage tail sheath protein FI